MRIAPLLGLLLLAPGCVLHTRGPLPLPAPYPRPAPRPQPPPPPPSRPSAMGYDEAVSLGNNFCRSRGYDCRLKEAHAAEGGDKWKVKFAAYAPSGARGHLHLEYNTYSRALLKVNEKVKERGHGRGKGKGHGKHDRDWDDDDWDD